MLMENVGTENNLPMDFEIYPQIFDATAINIPIIAAEFLHIGQMVM
jgi:hypothetical protein